MAVYQTFSEPTMYVKCLLSLLMEQIFELFRNSSAALQMPMIRRPRLQFAFLEIKNTTKWFPTLG